MNMVITKRETGATAVMESRDSSEWIRALAERVEMRQFGMPLAALLQAHKVATDAGFMFPKNIKAPHPIAPEFAQYGMFCLYMRAATNMALRKDPHIHAVYRRAINPVAHLASAIVAAELTGDVKGAQERADALETLIADILEAGRIDQNPTRREHFASTVYMEAYREFRRLSDELYASGDERVAMVAKLLGTHFIKAGERRAEAAMKAKAAANETEADETI